MGAVLGGYTMRVDGIPEYVDADLDDQPGWGVSTTASSRTKARPSPPTLSPTPGPPNEPGAEIPSAPPPDIPKKIPKKFRQKSDQSCAVCYFAIPHETQGGYHLACHAHAPRPTATTDRVLWPSVAATNWCGEWLDSGDNEDVDL